MESRITVVDEVTRQVAVTVPAEEVTRALEGAYRRLNQRVKLQGFRKGKAPRRMLEALYGHQVEHEVAEDLVGRSLQEAAASNRLEAVGRPKVEGATLREGEPLVFTATVQVIPPFELRPLGGERLVKRVVRVTEEEVEAQLGRLAEQFASYEASNDEALAAGDYAVVDFCRLEGGHEVAEGKVENHPLILGDGALHPVFEERLTGARHGEVREVVVPPGEELTEERRFNVTVKEVKKRRVPPIDDSLARTVGKESLEAVRATLRREMERLEEARAQERLRADLSRRLVELHSIPLPDALLEHAMNRLLGDLQRSMAARGHRLEASQIEAEKLSERLQGPARELATSDLILDRVAGERDLRVGEGELQAEVARLARRMEKDPSALRREMEAQGTLEGLRLDMRRRLALDTLLADLQVEEKTVDRKDVEENS